MLKDIKIKTASISYLLFLPFIFQDKSSCIAPQTVKYLIGDDDDVIHVNAGSGVITTHIASLMHTSTGHILAFDANKSAMNKSMEKYGAKSILLK